MKSNLPPYIHEQLQALPKVPGVYKFIGTNQKLLYIGKAKILYNRVRQYFYSSNDTRWFISELHDHLKEIQFITTNNEKEAMLLEAELIRHHRPPYNVVFKDDKRFLMIRIDINHQFPRIEVVRQEASDNALYFGPYHSALSIRRTIKFLTQQFMLRTCTDYQLATRLNQLQKQEKRCRPCMQYFIKRCSAPCCGHIDYKSYQLNLKSTLAFLQGKSQQLITQLHTNMAKAAQSQNYELAAKYRDQITAIENSLESQALMFPNGLEMDVFGIARDHRGISFKILIIRKGRLIDDVDFTQEHSWGNEKELLGSFIWQWYHQQKTIPAMVLVPFKPAWDEEIGSQLENLQKGKLRLSVPQKGKKFELLKRAQENASHELHKLTFIKDEFEQLKTNLKKKLHLKKAPTTIDCIDISQMMGQQVVGVVISYVHGKQDKSRYRKFIIKGKLKDDFSSVYEVCLRYLRRAKDDNTLPDTLMIDGGKGQLAAAHAAIDELALSQHIDLIAIAKARSTKDSTTSIKSRERFFLVDRKNPVLFKQHSKEENFLASVRNETHRFAITFHRHKRAQKIKHSVLDSIPGIGPKKRRLLLQTFKSIDEIKNARIEELTKIPGITPPLANTIIHYLHELSDT